MAKKKQPADKTKSAERAIEKLCSSYSDLINTYEDMRDIQFERIMPQLTDALVCTGASVREYDDILIKSLCNSIRNSTSLSGEISKMSSIGDDGIRGQQSTLQQYFTNIGKLYQKHNNDYNIEYCEENRDKLIEMNLKSVISIAKRYVGNGLTLEELISAGNEGLCVAFDKYDPSRQKLRDNIIEKINDLSDDAVLTSQDLEVLFDGIFQYGNLSNAFKDQFVENQKYNKNEVEQWVQKNIRPAKFNSIAVMWINAYIIIELDKYSRIIRKPKKDIKNESAGLSPKDVYVEITSPIGNEGRSLENTMPSDDSNVDSLEIEEAHKCFRNALAILFDGIGVRNRRIIMQRYGIGLPRPMSPKEISQRENISIARISQIIKRTMDCMQMNYKKHKDQIDPDMLYDILDRCGKCM